ncbi:hypothetical protein [Microbacterium sp. P05]|uniref:hypothetical protein n=1 Tax=Microbacterium sp. P05 TaxID=3366948 RepID=UPI0037471F7D
MQIILAIVIGAAIGFAAHFLVAYRSTRGVAVAPLIGAAVGAAWWTALTWAGVGIDNPWIWLSAIAVPALVTVLTLWLLGVSRTRADDRERQRLGLA